MTRWNGSILGVTNNPNFGTGASGIWGNNEASLSRKEGNWPIGILEAEVLLVGGGASGNDGHNAGGNGGSVEALSGIEFLPNTNFTITVGSGGAQRGNGSQNGFNSGSSSSISGTGVSLTASGGTAASSAGDGGNNLPSGRNGGNGEQWAINGTYYGGGGGVAGGNGYETSPGGSGGLGGGGYGSTCCGTPGSAGTNGLGGGGGGGGISWCGTIYCGGRRGGSGVVIISYPGTSAFATGGTITNSDGRVFHTFTSSGIFNFDGG